MIIKRDKRKGVKPSKELSKQITKLFSQYTVRHLEAKLDTSFTTLKRIENRQNVKEYKIEEVEFLVNKINSENNIIEQRAIMNNLKITNKNGGQNIFS